MGSHLHLAGLAALVLVVGCRDDAAVDAKEGLPPTEETDETLGERAKRLGADARDTLAEALERGIEQADTQLSELRARFGPNLEQASEATRERWDAIMQGLEESRQDAALKLEELRTASYERYEEAKQTYQEAYERLQRRIAEAREKLDQD